MLKIKNIKHRNLYLETCEYEILLIFLMFPSPNYKLKYFKQFCRQSAVVSLPVIFRII